MSLSVCRNSTTVTVSEGMLKQQLGESRGEVTALKSIVASLKAELDAQRVSQKIQQFRMGGAAPGPQAGSRTGACDANNTNNSTGGGPVPLDGDKNPAPKGNSRFVCGIPQPGTALPNPSSAAGEGAGVANEK